MEDDGLKVVQKGSTIQHITDGIAYPRDGETCSHSPLDFANDSWNVPDAVHSDLTTPFWITCNLQD